MNRYITFVLVCVALVGISNAISVSSPEAMRIANFLVADIGSGVTLVKIISIKKQVVNGMMYHIVIKVRSSIPGGFTEYKRCEAKVFESRQGRLSVSSKKCRKVNN